MLTTVKKETRICETAFAIVLLTVQVKRNWGRRNLQMVATGQELVKSSDTTSSKECPAALQTRKKKWRVTLFSVVLMEHYIEVFVRCYNWKCSVRVGTESQWCPWIRIRSLCSLSGPFWFCALWAICIYTLWPRKSPPLHFSRQINSPKPFVRSILGLLRDYNQVNNKLSCGLKTCVLGICPFFELFWKFELKRLCLYLGILLRP